VGDRVSFEHHDRRSLARAREGEADARAGSGSSLIQLARLQRARARRAKRGAAIAEEAAPLLRDGADEPGARFAEATQGGGDALPFQKDMERAFGQDLTGVKAHLGRKDALDGHGASAAARGDTVAFASSSPDRELVAHELTHVVQQRRGGTAGVHAKSEVGAADSPLEHEADAIAPRAAAGARVHVGQGGGGLQLKVYSKDEFEDMLDRGAKSAKALQGIGNGKYTASRSKMKPAVGIVAELEDPQLAGQERRDALERLQQALKGLPQNKKDKYQTPISKLERKIEEELADLPAEEEEPKGKPREKEEPSRPRSHAAASVPAEGLGSSSDGEQEASADGDQEASAASDEESGEEKAPAAKAPNKLLAALQPQIEKRPRGIGDEEGSEEGEELGDASKDAISGYMKQGGSEDVNAGLRDLKGREMKRAQHDQARDMMSGLHKLSPTEASPLYRASDTFPDGSSDPERLEAGLKDQKTYRDPAFFSTSCDKNVALGDPRQLKIMIVSHKSGRDISQFATDEQLGETEQEVVFYPGTSFEYLGREGVWYKFKEV
jgi:hypothetical protein